MIKNKSKSAPYYNIGQLRVDYWNKLKIETSELTRCRKGSVNEKTHKQKVKELIKDLKGVECFFAFPGKERLQKLENAFSSHEYASLSHLVSETTRQLLGDSYKSNPDFLILMNTVWSLPKKMTKITVLEKIILRFCLSTIFLNKKRYKLKHKFKNSTNSK